MDLGLKGRVAIVTASSRGLGRGTAEAFADEGASVVIAARGAESLLETEKALRDRGVEVLAIECDLADAETPTRLVQSTLEQFGRLDIIVANNGGPVAVKALEASDDAILGAVNANMLFAVRLVREGLPHMLESGWGRICCVASFSILQAMPHISLSNTSRSALWAWAKTGAHDLMGTGVTLNLACPGLHATGHIQSRQRIGTAADGNVPMMAPEQIAGDPYKFGQAIAFLCSDQAGYISGMRFVIDGGRSLAL